MESERSEEKWEQVDLLGGRRSGPDQVTVCDIQEAAVGERPNAGRSVGLKVS